MSPISCPASRIRTQFPPDLAPLGAEVGSGQSSHQIRLSEDPVILVPQPILGPGHPLLSAGMAALHCRGPTTTSAGALAAAPNNPGASCMASHAIIPLHPTKVPLEEGVFASPFPPLTAWTNLDTMHLKCFAPLKPVTLRQASEVAIPARHVPTTSVPAREVSLCPPIL